MTKREVLTAMLNDANIKGNENYIAYIQNELAILTKKAENRRPTKNQVENEKIKDEILLTLCADVGVTVKDLREINANLEKYSTQRITAILRLLKIDGKILSYNEKSKTYYKLV